MGNRLLTKLKEWAKLGDVEALKMYKEYSEIIEKFGDFDNTNWEQIQELLTKILEWSEDDICNSTYVSVRRIKGGLVYDKTY